MSDFATKSLFDVSLPPALTRHQSPDAIALIRKIWLSDAADLPRDEAAIHNAFVRHLRDTMEVIRRQQHYFDPCTMSTAADMINLLQSRSTQKLIDLVQERREQLINIDEATVRRTFELCVRLWLTVNVNTSDVAVGSASSREHPFDWDNDESLCDLISKAFVKPAKGLHSKSGDRVDSLFTAAYLVSRCGLKISWTNYLTDHLRLDPSRRVLLVFRHKSYLHLQCNRTSQGPVSQEVFSEALDTLNLLFPFGNKPTEELLLKHGEREFYDFGSCSRRRVLGLGRYGYWRKELEALLEVFESPPRTWKQLAFDDRNKLEWSAFWVTVMVAILTLVSVPCSIIQAVYSVKAYNLALAQSHGGGRDD